MGAHADRPLSVEDRYRDVDAALAAVDEAWTLVMRPSAEMHEAWAAVREAWVVPAEARGRGDDEAGAAGWDLVADRAAALGSAIAGHPAAAGPLMSAVSDLTRETRDLAARLRLDRRFVEIVDGLTFEH